MRRLFAVSLLVVLLAAGWFALPHGRDWRWDAGRERAEAEAIGAVQAFNAPGVTVCDSGQRSPGAELPSEYTQRMEVHGIRVVAPEGVSRDAMEAAAATIEEMFARNDLEDALADLGAYVVIADDTQHVLDLPEFACLAERPDSNLFDQACGLADHAAYPVVAVHELDLLGDPGGPCQGLNVLYHELGHLVQNYAIDKETDKAIGELYDAAISAGRYRRQYAGSNPHEYFAEGTQDYFHYGDPARFRDHDWLRDYDPGLFELLAELYGSAE